MFLIGSLPVRQIFLGQLTFDLILIKENIHVNARAGLRSVRLNTRDASMKLAALWTYKELAFHALEKALTRFGVVLSQD